ncbi:MAG TPA: hypothetical protein VMF61_13470, partial [Candidatus Acidoferrales bacterium]|nr:hypothetical protein [Candidatus Acidoferrales bacterium]
DQNPYGLAIPTFTYKGAVKHDLYSCNFNDKANVQGAGTTIVSLTPVAGSATTPFVQSHDLLGCAATAFDSSDDLWAASYGVKGIAEISAGTGKITIHKGAAYVHPWGLTFATTGGAYPTSAVFASDAETGDVILVASCSSGQCAYAGTPIVTGFPVNKGKPGRIFAPSGLVFDPNASITVKGVGTLPGALYVVDGKDNTVVGIYNVLNLRSKNSIVVGKTGKTFSGPEGSWARVLYSGSALRGPISAALVSTSASKPGNLVVGNTVGPNNLVEISPTGQVLDTVDVDKGAAGALFGIMAMPGTYGAKTQLFFNDDNANNVQVLEK